MICLAEIVAILIDGDVFRGQFTAAGFLLPADLRCFAANGAIAGSSQAAQLSQVGKICPFMYPPPFLLITAPLSRLGPAAVFIVWGVASSAVLVLAARAASITWRIILAGLVAPANLLCLIIGQTGTMISGLVLLSLALAETNAILAGVMAGCLAVKPQFGVLLPVCFLASRNWRALLAAAATTCLACLLPALFFGFDVWRHFFSSELGTARGVLNEPWPQNFQHIMISAFMLLRSLGAGLRIAYAVQSMVTVAAAWAAWRLWSQPVSQAGTDRHLARLAVTLCLMTLATPYAYVYDLPGLAMVLLAHASLMKWRTMLPLTVFWVLTSVYILVSAHFVSGAIFIMALAVFFYSGATQPNSRYPAAGH